MMTYKDFVAFEENTYKCIKLNPLYIDITGDILAGLLLSQIVYWNLPSKKSNSKRSGEYLIKRREDWYEETRLTPRQIDRVIKILTAKNIITVKVQKTAIYNGAPVHHIKLNIDKLMELVNKNVENVVESASPQSNPKSPNGDFTSPNGDLTSPNGDPHITTRGSLLYTETTTETTTETNLHITNPLVTEESVTKGKLGQKSSKEREGENSLRINKESPPAACSSIVQNTTVPQSILDAIDPLCQTYFGSNYSIARSFFSTMTITSNDHIDQLMGIGKVIFERYPAELVCAVINTLLQKKNCGELQYYNPTYFLNALEEESDMQHIYTKFKQFCIDYFSSAEDALEVYNFYTNILKSKEDRRAAKLREAIPLHERRMRNVTALVEKYGLLSFLKMIRHYSQKHKEGKLRQEPSMDRFSNYAETYTKYQSNPTQKPEILITPVVQPEKTEEKMVMAVPVERIMSKYTKREWEYHNWSYRCECGTIIESMTEECPHCHSVIDQNATGENFNRMLFKCDKCGETLFEFQKTCHNCNSSFDFEGSVGRLAQSIKNNEELKDEYGANVRVSQDEGHRDTQ